MNIAGMSIVGNLASLACVAGAIYLASTGNDAWGWFLFGAVLTATDVEVKPKCKSKHKEKEYDTRT